MTETAELHDSVLQDGVLHKALTHLEGMQSCITASCVTEPYTRHSP